MNATRAADIAASIEQGQTFVGIEMGSTRIKAVLIGPDYAPIASGGFGWENKLAHGVWTYDLEEVWSGLRACFADLQMHVQAKYGMRLRRPGALGISGMMHGYLAFDAGGRQLAPFRTWRNNLTGAASEELTRLFDYPIPQRWSISHLYQSILNGEEHVGRIARLTTLAGYVHQKLTGRNAMGIGEASGMFPIDIGTQDFNAGFAAKFDALVRGRKFGWKLRALLPEVLPAGHQAGTLTAEGAKLLDPAGDLEAGIPLCPPEGDAGTGMVATNSVGVRTGNVSAGTSVFAMLVLEKELSRAHREIDLVTTPDGKLVGMAHANNCTSDFNAWMGLFGEAAKALGAEVSGDELFNRMKRTAMEGDANCGGLLTYGYISGEHLTGFGEGRPVFARAQDCRFTLANFIRAHLYSALCALRAGVDVLVREEKVAIDEIRGHGGFFKTEGVGQRIMAAALNVPVSVLATAGEGGAWGIALLAAYMTRARSGLTLPEAGARGPCCAPRCFGARGGT
jgi:sugar (pentulose or hexulose) kinase